MRITTLHDDLTICGIEVPLRILAASANPLEAASWVKLLELVDYLQSSESERELSGHILLQELILSEPVPPNQEVQEFIEKWCASNPDPAAWGNKLHHEMKRFHKPGVSVTVRADWRDYGSIRDGIPIMHFRFRVKRPDRIATQDARAQGPSEAKRIICGAFGW